MLPPPRRAYNLRAVILADVATLVSSSSTHNQTPACYAAGVKKTRGFSLVELSIILVILGLLVGGVLTGQSLIRAAELRKTTSFQNEFTGIVHTFRDKYLALPGDMPNATSFWGRSNVALNNCTTQPGTASADGTCNGNGDGLLVYTAARPGEQYLFGHHLRLAGLLNLPLLGTYSGNPMGRGFYTPGLSNPAFSWMGGCDNSGGCSGFSRRADLYTWLTGGSTAQGNALQTSAPTSTIGTIAVAIIKSEEFWNIDTKIDDGLPQSGILRGMDGLTSDGSAYLSCVVTASGNTAYNVTYADKACRFLLLIN